MFYVESTDSKSKKPLLFILFIIFNLTACSITLPNPPTATLRYPTRPKPNDIYHYKRPSPFFEAIQSTPINSDFTQALKANLLDATWRCEQRMNVLIPKIRNQRTAQSLITILGGSASASTSIISASLDEDKADAKTVLAAISAGTAVIAIIGGVIGSPADTIQLYLASLSSYRHATDTVLTNQDWRSKAGEVLKHLNQCGDTVKALK